jgi:hypothetical protein
MTEPDQFKVAMERMQAMNTASARRLVEIAAEMAVMVVLRVVDHEDRSSIYQHAILLMIVFRRAHLGREILQRKSRATTAALWRACEPAKDQRRYSDLFRNIRLASVVERFRTYTREISRHDFINRVNKHCLLIPLSNRVQSDTAARLLLNRHFDVFGENGVVDRSAYDVSQRLGEVAFVAKRHQKEFERLGFNGKGNRAIVDDNRRIVWLARNWTDGRELVRLEGYGVQHREVFHVESVEAVKLR